LRFKRFLKRNLLSIDKETRHFLTLFKHFVIRLFNNDILKFENQRRENLAILLSFLIVGGGLVSFVILWPYLKAAPGFTSETAWIEKTFFITLSMAFTGIISVITWDNMFLDERDYLYLSGLPVKTGTLFSAKFFSLMVFVGLLTAALNFVPLFIFTFYLGEAVNVNPFYNTSIFEFAFVHLLSAFMANLFVFLSVASIQSVLMMVSDAKRFKKVSMIVQSLLLIGFVSVLIWFPQMAASIAGLRDSYSSFIYYFPPMWFTGFYEQLIGNYDYVFKKQFYTAAVSITLLIDIYILSMPLSFKRFSRSTVNSSINGRLNSSGNGLKRWFDRVVLKHPVQRAMFYFSLAAVSRSRKHKLQLSTAIALPLTFTISEVVVLSVSKGPAYLHQVQPFLVALPFVIYFFLVAGFRIMVLHPVNAGAGWIFRMTETREPSHYLAGVKKVFYLLVIMPVFLLLFLFYLYFWGFPAALFHSLFSTAAACLMLETAFIGYNKMPFVSTYVPGKARLRELWVLYLAGFALYIVFFTWLGSLMLRNPLLYIAYYLFVFDAFFLVRRYRRKRNRSFDFVFDEEPEPAMLSLGLD
jgi:hypothetical protein